MINICLLIIYSDTPYYNNMTSILDNYYNTFKIALENKINLSYYFISYKNDLENNSNIEVKNNFIYVKGDEYYLGILNKTIEALEYITKSEDNDYYIRTNLSTIININLLIELLHKLPKTNVYTGGRCLTINWLDYKAGITGKIYYGTRFITGTSIILSKDFATELVNNKHKLNYNLVDDVAIGYYFTMYYKEIVNILGSGNILPYEFIWYNSELDKMDYDKIFYRINNAEHEKDRNKDVERLNIVSKKILEKYNL